MKIRKTKLKLANSNENPLINIRKKLFDLSKEKKISSSNLAQFFGKLINEMMQKSEIDLTIDKSLLKNLFDQLKIDLDRFHGQNIRNITEIIVTDFNKNDDEIIKLVRKLENYGTNVNQLDDSDLSLLHIAVIYNRQTLVRFLLNNGANPNLLTRDGSKLTALDHILYSMRDASEYKEELFIELISHNALIDFRSLPADIRELCVSEYKRNSEIIEKEIFNNIFRNIYKNQFGDNYSLSNIKNNLKLFYNFMRDSAEKYYFLNQSYTNEILDEKISIYLTNISNIISNIKELSEQNQTLICEDVEREKVSLPSSIGDFSHYNLYRKTR